MATETEQLRLHSGCQRLMSMYHFHLSVVVSRLGAIPSATWGPISSAPASFLSLFRHRVAGL